MSTEHAGDELTPRQRLTLADLFYKIGVLICLFVGAAILTGTPITVALKYAPPGLLAISFGLFLRDFADVGDEEEVGEP